MNTIAGFSRMLNNICNLESLYKQYEDAVITEIIHNDAVLLSKKDLQKIKKMLDKIAKKNKKIIKMIQENTVDKNNEPTKLEKENGVLDDSTVVRDKIITSTKKAKVNKKDTTINNVDLTEIKLDYEIEKQPGMLPVECKCLNANCVFTPQKTVIIKKGSIIAEDFISNKEKLSKLTQLNIIRAIKRKELNKICKDNKVVYEVLGDLTCSSRLDASKLISGSTDIKNIHFYVGNMLLNDYLNTGKIK